MTRFLFLLLFLFVTLSSAHTQVSWFREYASEEVPYKWFLHWGYNRANFTSTNLHFTGPAYDFSLYDVEATDRPTPFSFKVYFNPATMWIPQYNVRMGWFFKPRWSLSFGVDHMKYVMKPNQELRLSGIITEAASEKYAGAYLNETRVIKPDFLTFEHSDGLNLTTLEAAYNFPVMSWRTGGLEWYNGLGALWVVTRTDVRVFGDGLNNDFHVAGYSLSAKSGLRLTVFKRFFILFEQKAGYMSLPAVLIKNEAPEIADHNLVFWERIMAAGVRF